MKPKAKDAIRESFAVAALSFCAGFGSILCVITAYDLPYMPLALAVFSILFCLFFSFAFALGGKGRLLLIPPGLYLAGVLLFARGELVAAAKAVVQAIGNALAVHFSFIPGAINPLAGEVPPDGTLFLIVVSLLLLLYLSWSLTRFGNFLLTVWAFVPFFTLSLLRNYQYPSMFALILVLTFLIVMVLSTAARVGDFKQYPRLTLRLLPLVLGALLLLSAIFPHDGYNPDSKLANLKASLDEAFASWQEGRRQDSLLKEQPEQDLKNLGDQAQSDAVVFEVLSEQAGEIRLRGHSLAVYTGSSWQRVAEENKGDPGASLMLAALAVSNPTASRLTLRIPGRGGYVLYAPYYVQSLLSQTRATEEYVEASVRASEYTWNYVPQATSQLLPFSAGSELYTRELSYRVYVNRNYLTVPKGTGQAFAQLLKAEGVKTSGDRAEVVRQVLEYVRGAAEYTLTPGWASRQNDFVLTFLREEKLGYCVHFATAGAALLQSLDIPARYVSGYLVSVAEADVWTPVTVDDAHAWIEVYFDGIGWIPFDPTPGRNLGVFPNTDHAAVWEPPVTPTPAPQVTPRPMIAPATPNETPVPEPTPGPSVAQTERGSHPWGIWPPVLLILSAVLLWLRRKALVTRREARFENPARNRAYIAMWVYATQLADFGIEMPQVYLTIALKAAFSQHEVTEGELYDMREFMARARLIFAKKPLSWKKLKALWIACL